MQQQTLQQQTRCQTVHILGLESNSLLSQEPARQHSTLLLAKKYMAGGKPPQVGVLGTCIRAYPHKVSIRSFVN